MTLVAADFDEDGWTDIFVVCDSNLSLLFMKITMVHSVKRGSSAESRIIKVLGLETILDVTL